MAAPTMPQKKQANGKDTWWLVPAIAAPGAPTALEVNSVSGLNITCFLLAEQGGLTGTTSKVSLPRLLCETSTTEGLDTTTWSMSDITGLFDPQAASGSDGKLAWEFLKDGFTGFAVRRQGAVSANDAAVTAGQFVDVVPVDISAATPDKTSTGSDGLYAFMAQIAVTDDPSFNVAVV